jgi:undecaprenyl-diphosphatase
MNIFDTTILAWINRFAQQCPPFDRTLAFITHSHMFKGGVLVAITLWLWFKKDTCQLRNRERILACYAGSLAAIALARSISFLMPFRVRPLHAEGLNFILPCGVLSGELSGWSSFPSDHAVLFFAIATGLAFVSRRAGICALLYTTVLIVFPRLYFGFHYPSDIIAGAGMGIIIAVISGVYLGKGRLRPMALRSYANPVIFYPVFSLFLFQVFEMFDSIRSILRRVLNC